MLDVQFLRLFEVFNTLFPALLDILYQQFQILGVERFGDICIGSTQITNNPRDEVFMKELVELIMANLTKEDFGVTEITTHLRISRSLLHMKLKSLTGCSITQFIRTIKMKEAKTHLLNGMNVSEASFAVGISDPNYFTKCFKKEFNITPTEFLKQLK